MNKKQLSLQDILAIALPMIISQASETIMLFADRLFLSRLGAIPLKVGLVYGNDGLFYLCSRTTCQGFYDNFCLIHRFCIGLKV